MKNKLTIFLFLMIAIPLFGQNIEKSRNAKLIIVPLPSIDIKPIKNNYKEQYWNDIKYKVCYKICGMGRCQPDPNLLYIPTCGVFFVERYKHVPLKKKVKELTGTEASKYSSSVSNCSVIISTNEQDRKRYIALKERHNSRYPISKTQKIPELQTELKEIRF